MGSRWMWSPGQAWAHMWDVFGPMGRRRRVGALISRDGESLGILDANDPVFPPRQGFLRGYSVKKRLMRSIGKVRLATWFGL